MWRRFSFSFFFAASSISFVILLVSHTHHFPFLFFEKTERKFFFCSAFLFLVWCFVFAYERRGILLRCLNVMCMFVSSFHWLSFREFLSFPFFIFSSLFSLLSFFGALLLYFLFLVMPLFSVLVPFYFDLLPMVNIHHTEKAQGSKTRSTARQTKRDVERKERSEISFHYSFLLFRCLQSSLLVP